MSQITVRVDAYFVNLEIQEDRIVSRTIRVGRDTREQRERVTDTRTIESGWDNSAFRASIDGANEIWKQADIQFQAANPEIRCFRPPGNASLVNESTYQYMINQTQGSPGRITALLVRQFARWDLGGQASRGTCIMPSTLTEHNRGRVFAHEFGHLLGLPHLEVQGQNLQNLMRPGLVAGNQLLPDQIATARGSQLATRAIAALLGTAGQ